MLDVARVGRDDVLFDLGSGDGRIVVAAARKFGTRGVGIEIDSSLVRVSRRNADTAHVAHLAEFRVADLFETDLRSASVVTLYLLTDLNIRLRPKLFAELRPGSRVVSHAFGMGDWKPDSTLLVDTRIINYWVMPADIAGSWRIVVDQPNANSAFEIHFGQKYQQITLSTTSAGAIISAMVRGASIEFVVRESGRERRFAGRVDGNTMSGAVFSGSDSVAAWRGTRTLTSRFRREDGLQTAGWAQAAAAVREPAETR
jgi:hypothetical protein